MSYVFNMKNMHGKKCISYRQPTLKNELFAVWASANKKVLLCIISVVIPTEIPLLEVVFQYL